MGIISKYDGPTNLDYTHFMYIAQYSPYANPPIFWAFSKKKKHQKKNFFLHGIRTWPILIDISLTPSTAPPLTPYNIFPQIFSSKSDKAKFYWVIKDQQLPYNNEPNVFLLNCCDTVSFLSHIIYYWYCTFCILPNIVEPFSILKLEYSTFILTEGWGWFPW